MNIIRKPKMVLAHLTAEQTWVDWWYFNGSKEIKKNGYIIKSVGNTSITFGTVWTGNTSACEYWIIY